MATTRTTAAMPQLIYGTAWKKDRTADLVYKAIKNGFRGIDTAAQPKHYEEDMVGHGVQKAIAHEIVTRRDLFLQTKFTNVDGHDHNRMPYDPKLSLPEQVHASVLSSFAALKVTSSDSYLDALVLHSPMRSHSDTMQVWRQMEKEASNGRILRLGISNIYDATELERLYLEATVKPTIVQNRFYGETNHDAAIRAFCDTHGITYQSFWTLTANPDLVNCDAVSKIALAKKWTNVQVFYRLLMDMKIVPLSGTTSENHMCDDVAIIDSPLEKSVVQRLRLTLFA
eukprot:CFRG7038T1